jgi:aspartyl/asparaginyl-tRNA synthetase
VSLLTLQAVPALTVFPAGEFIEGVERDKGTEIHTNDRLDAGASVRLKGQMVTSKGSGQARELLVESTEVIGGCDPEVSLRRTKRERHV